MATEIVIIVAAIITTLLIIILVVAAIRRTQNKKDPQQHHVGVVGMEGIMIETTKRRGSVPGVPHSPPELDRAQKFRERARSTVIGRPEFKLSTKKSSKKEDLYQTLGTQLDFEAVADKGPRRTSEDTTSHNSDPDSPKGPFAVEDYALYSAEV